MLWPFDPVDGGTDRQCLTFYTSLYNPLPPFPLNYEFSLTIGDYPAVPLSIYRHK